MQDGFNGPLGQPAAHGSRLEFDPAATDPPVSKDSEVVEPVLSDPPGWFKQYANEVGELLDRSRARKRFENNLVSTLVACVNGKSAYVSDAEWTSGDSYTFLALAYELVFAEDPVVELQWPLRIPFVGLKQVLKNRILQVDPEVETDLQAALAYVAKDLGFTRNIPLSQIEVTIDCGTEDDDYCLKANGLQSLSIPAGSKYEFQRFAVRVAKGIPGEVVPHRELISAIGDVDPSGQITGATVAERKAIQRLNRVLAGWAKTPNGQPWIRNDRRTGYCLNIDSVEWRIVNTQLRMKLSRDTQSISASSGHSADFINDQTRDPLPAKSKSKKTKPSAD